MSSTVARLIRSLCLALLVMSLSSSVSAAQALPITYPAKALAAVNLRDSIPAGPFSSSTVLTVIQPGEVVTVYEQRDIVTFLRTDQWLKVGTPAGLTGWAYNGIPGQTAYFLAVR